MAFDEEAVVGLVVEFCRGRRVDRNTSVRAVPTLAAAFKVLALKGPDERWQALLGRSCPQAGARISTTGSCTCNGCATIWPTASAAGA